MARHDLTVMGGGIMGLCCAWEAARRGLRVRLVERTAIGAGASGGLVGALAPHAPEQWTAAKAFQLQALLAAEGFWAEVQAAGGVSPGHLRAGRLQPIQDEAGLALAQARAAAATELWQGQARWEVVPAGGAFAPLSPSGFLVHDTLTARVSPRRALASLMAALKAKGAEVMTGGTVVTGEEVVTGAGIVWGGGILRGPEVVLGAAKPAAVAVPEGDPADPFAVPMPLAAAPPPPEADTDTPVIWATGHWGLAELTQTLGRKIGQGVKGQALSLYLPGYETAPQIYAEGVHIVPHVDGTIAIGSTSENTWTDEAPDAQADALLAKARALVPALAQAPEIGRWSGIRPRAQSRGPLLGPWPLRPGHYVANGGFKIGFALPPLMARLLLDLIEGEDRIPESFRL